MAIHTYPKTKRDQILIQLPSDRDLSSTIEISLEKLLIKPDRHGRMTTTAIDGVSIDGKPCKMNE
jgi:hypothetical protein